MALGQSTSALLVALLSIAFAAFLYSETLLQHLGQLPLNLQRFTPSSSHDTRDGVSTPPSSNGVDEVLDFQALRAYADANSQDTLRWGTYRSSLYYGVRSRTYPYYVAAGLLWGSQHEDISQLRHECRQEDRLQKYGWLKHDGKRYGFQNIEDQYNRVELKTHYMRLMPHDDKETHIDGWASRIEVTPLEPRDERLRKKRVKTTKLSLFFYFDLGCEDESLGHECRHVLKNLIDVDSEPVSAPCASDEVSTCTQLRLASEGIQGDDETKPTLSAPLAFNVQLQLKATNSIQSTELRYSGLKDTNVLNVKDRIVALAERVRGNDDEVNLDNIIEDGSTLVVVQAIVEVDMEAFHEGDVALDILFNEGSVAKKAAAPIDSIVSAQVETRARAFDAQFDAAFQLSTKKLSPTDDVVFNKSHIAFAKAAFSNLIGGIGYFYGSSLVQHDANSPEIIESASKPLFTAVPSRSFFPRGFVWDEGFHQLGIAAFDSEIARDVIAHWLGLMGDDGYIAREQVLGESARRRVPNEFLVQHVEHANPPSLLLCLERMVSKDVDNLSPSAQKELRTFVRLVFPFLERWYDWLVRTQYGPVMEDEVASFRWRGRKINGGKLISNTLASGLDDYPRASLPSQNEMHVDLISWMAKTSDIMATLTQYIDHNAAEAKAQRFQADKSRFLVGLDKFHWNEQLQSYFDVGDHSEDGRIEHHVAIRCRNDEGEIIDATASMEQVRTRTVKCPVTHATYLFPLGDGKGGLQLQQMFIPGTTKLQHVKHIGYVSIFPLLLKVLPPDSPKLRALLHQLANPEHLWSPFGLRSMSTTDLFYERENASGDNPYWRGSIWINANYLALDALHHYAQPETASPFRDEFQKVYDALRTNVISTIFREYERTGYLWEQYSGDIHAAQQYGKGQRCHPFSGWTALVVNIMAEKY
uniref:Mannosyl-oligosaccharide glucosidase n=1 Tax=Globisporangium ultimum (strain ATCC 200006 / CBS 805.95 / DAOM BR144) TaxID=431595 RepID=K3W5A0_GLOUD